MGLEWLLFFLQVAHFFYDVYGLVRDAWHIQNEAIATFFIIYVARVNILLIVKVKILVLIKWS